MVPMMVWFRFPMVPRPCKPEHSSTKSVLLNPNRCHPNPPNDNISFEIQFPVCVANDGLFGFSNGASLIQRAVLLAVPASSAC